jgi:hypothetical protein
MRGAGYAAHMAEDKNMTQNLSRITWITWVHRRRWKIIFWISSAIAQAVSRWLPTAAARVQTRV